MKPRILFGGLVHETHTFLAETTGWSDFEVTRGAEIWGKEGDESPAAGFLEEAKRLGWDVVPTIDARAMASGPVEDEAFERFWREFAERAVPALAAGVEAIFLVLHGAMATPTIDDVEGEFLARLRGLPGAAGLPLFGVLDLHGNISARMCALADGLVAYRENPHADAKETAVRAAGLLDRCLTTKIRPSMSWCRIPVLWAPPATGTRSGPMHSLRLFAERIERLDSAVWAVNIFSGFTFADTASTGVSISLVSELPLIRARPFLEEGGRLAWRLREQGMVEYSSADAILASQPISPHGPILLVEPADNIGGGAPGSGTGVLRALLRHRVASGLVAINDPAAVARLAAIQPGEKMRLPIGAAVSALDPGPVELEVALISRSDGLFELEDPQSHLASLTGTQVAMGDCAVVRQEGVTILLTSRKTPPFDLGQFRSQGIEPRSFSWIGVKAAVGHRRAYDSIAAAEYWVDTPGPCSSNLASFQYRRLPRPVYPLDSIVEPALNFS